MIFLPRRAIRVLSPLDQPAALQPLEAVGEDVARNPLGRRLEFREPTLVIEQQIANDQQRPPIADQIEGAGDRTR